MLTSRQVKLSASSRAPNGRIAAGQQGSRVQEASYADYEEDLLLELS